MKKKLRTLDSFKKAISINHHIIDLKRAHIRRD